MVIHNRIRVYLLIVGLSLLTLSACVASEEITPVPDQSNAPRQLETPTQESVKTPTQQLPTNIPDPTASPNPTLHLEPTEESFDLDFSDYSEILQRQFSYWSQIEVRDVSGYGDAYLAITYLSPQLVEAVVKYRAQIGEIEPNEIGEIIRESEMKLERETKIPFFVVALSSNQNRNLAIQMSMWENMRLVDVRGDQFPPLEFTHTFDLPITLDQPRRALVYFQRYTEEGDDILEDSSFSVRANNVKTGYVYASNNSFQSHLLGEADLTYSYNLVPATVELERFDKRIQTLIENSNTNTSTSTFDFGSLWTLIEILVTVVSFL